MRPNTQKIYIKKSVSKSLPDILISRTVYPETHKIPDIYNKKASTAYWNEHSRFYSVFLFHFLSCLLPWGDIQRESNRHTSDKAPQQWGNIHVLSEKKTTHTGSSAVLGNLIVEFLSKGSLILLNCMQLLTPQQAARRMLSIWTKEITTYTALQLKFWGVT